MGASDSTHFYFSIGHFMPRYPTMRCRIFFSSRLHKRHSNQNASEYMCESFESVFTLLEINVECRDYDL